MESICFLLTDGKQRHEVMVFNSSPWEQTDLVCLPQGETAEDWLDAHNRPLETQQVDGKQWVKVENVPSMGYG